jgi:hypothetical protein
MKMDFRFWLIFAPDGMRQRKCFVGFRHKKTALLARSRTIGLTAERHRGRAVAAGLGRRRDRFVVMVGI